jgi:hypothetical protein
MRSTSIAKLVALSALLSGCHMFVPTHPGTWLVGSIEGVDGRPIANAKVTLYGTTSMANSNGCFNVHLPDALPFTFVVTAIGHKAIEMKASPGFFRVEAKLVPDQSLASSSAKWIGITESEYRSSKPCE